MNGAHASASPPSDAGGAGVVRERGLAGVPGVIHGFSERRGGVSGGRYASLNLGPRGGDALDAVRTNRGRFLAALGLGDAPVLAPRQIHSADVTVVRANDGALPSHVVAGDGVVTDIPGVALMVLAADCLPLLLYDPVRRVAGAVHAGWRGTAGGIAATAVAVMRDGFGCDPADVWVALGPAIGRCCYEVGPEVVDAVAAVTPLPLADVCDPRPAGKAMLDLVAANTAQLRAAGVSAMHIGALDLCTACGVDRFYSHRRDGEPTGRAGAVIAMARPDPASSS